MKKIKENILFVIIFFIIYTLLGKICFHFLLEDEKTWLEVMIQSGFVVFVLLIAKILGFLDKKKKSLE
ncbi:MAG: hypothetical protein ACERIH_05165 [Labilibaculum antarcticum]